MQKRLLSLCLVLTLFLLCSCGQKAVTGSPVDAPSAPAKQETHAVAPAAETTAEKEEAPAAPVEKVTETAAAEAKTPVEEDTPVIEPEPVSDTPGVPAPTEPTPAAPPVQPSADSCTISIVCHTAVGKSDAAPASGVILSPVTVTLAGGESVYDVLCGVCSANGIALGGSSGYIKSIGGLAERACGGGSGWLYRVNGTTPGVGCGSYSVADGDSIEWVYTCEMGNDL